MALSPSDFQGGAGNLRAAQFPGEDLDGLLAEWIADAEARADAAGVATDGALARAWVMHRAYGFLCHVGAPTAVQAASVEGEGSVTYAKATAPDWCALATTYRRDAGALASVYDVTPVTTTGFKTVRFLR